MTTITTTRPAFVLRGLVDDVDTCECCGKRPLKRAVMLGVTDADGNVDDVVYYGTRCASLALGRGGERRDATRIEQEARAAEQDWQARAAVARDRIAVYGPVEHGSVRDRAELYYGRNPHMRDRGVKATAEVAALLASARAVLAERGIVS